MKVLVTGAGGFIGRALCLRLLSAEHELGGSVSQLTMLDQRLNDIPRDPRVRVLEGDLTDTQVLDSATQDGVDTVFHLASIPGGLAEKNFELGMRVNLEGTVRLLDAVRRHGTPRFVFAGTIGIFGAPLPEVVDERTIPEPTLSYGAQKLIGEILVSDYSRRGFIDGCVIRLPGIVARPSQPSGLLSAFLSDSIRALAAGQRFTFPVSAEAKSWWMSRACVVDNLLHAARLSAEQLRRRRVWLLPVLHASMADIVAALASVHGAHVLGNVRYEPDAALQAQFASYPPLSCPHSTAAGFKHDGSLEQLVQRALEP
jgi:nucleoside-diphosphate-sugar epimerase